MGIGRARTATRGPTVVGSCRTASAYAAQARMAAALRVACRIRAERNLRRIDPAPVPPDQLAVERQVLSVARAAVVSGAEARAEAMAMLSPSLVSRVCSLAVHGLPA